MGGVVKAVSKIFGGGGSVKMPAMPEVPDYEGQRKAAEEEAQKKANARRAMGMSGTILGGALGDDNNVRRKKLLGE